MSAQRVQEPTHTQRLRHSLYFAIVEGSERQVCIGDAIKTGDLIRFEHRDQFNRYFLARVRSIDLGVATIAIAFVSEQP